MIEGSAPAAKESAGLHHSPLVIERLVRWYFLAALLYFAVSLLGGLIMAFQLVNHNPLKGIELFSPGRSRMIHTNAIAYGFIANAFPGHAALGGTRLTLKPVLDVRLVVLHLRRLAGGGAVYRRSASCWARPGSGMGRNAGVDRSAARWSAYLLVAINFGWPILQTPGPVYVSLWYFTAAFIWTFLTYAMGNFLPEYFLSGTSGGAMGGLFIHDLVGLFVTPIGWGMMYYFVPIMLKKPVWSHGLSLVGFWGLAFFYPLTGIHHFLYTPIPMFLQYGAVISTIAVEMVVVTVLINFFMTIRGNAVETLKHLPLRWFYTGMVLYGVTCLQCAFQTTLTFQQLIHFTDWVVAHAHLVMFGVFGFWILGTMTHLFPRLLKRHWYSLRLCEWHYWCSAIGMLIMFVDLTIAGIFQGFSWGSLKIWEDSLRVSLPFWWIRVAAGLTIIVGQLCFAVNLYRTYQTHAVETFAERELATHGAY